MVPGRTPLWLRRAPTPQQPEELLLVARKARVRQGLFGLGEDRRRDHRWPGGVGRTRRGVESGSDRVQQPQIRLDGGALTVGQYGGGHRRLSPSRGRAYGCVGPACRPPLTIRSPCPFVRPLSGGETSPKS